jgi:hypothetical protein
LAQHALHLVFHSVTQVYLLTCFIYVEEGRNHMIEEGRNHMKPFVQTFLWVTIGLATLSMGCAGMTGSSPTGTGSTTPSAASAESSFVTTGSQRVSQGTQGDTTDACMARIPSDASAGQRMIAEGTCRRDAANRASILAVPGQ